ncbi:INO80 complex subunit D-like [Ornithodoros turicata]
MNQNGTQLYRQEQLNGYTYCIRQIFEENALGYAHSGGNANKLNKCHGISNESQLYPKSVSEPCPKKEPRPRQRKEKGGPPLVLPPAADGRLKFADRLRALLKRESSISNSADGFPQDPYAFSEPPPPSWTDVPLQENGAVEQSCQQLACRQVGNGAASKTMNRLQAKIAQNKLLDKLKKAQDASSHNHYNHRPSPPAAVQNHVARVDCRQAAHPPSWYQTPPVVPKLEAQETGRVPVHLGAQGGPARRLIPAVSPLKAKEKTRDKLTKERIKAKLLPAPSPAIRVPPYAGTSDGQSALRSFKDFWCLEKNLWRNDALRTTEMDSSDSDLSDDDDSMVQKPPSFWNWDLDCSDASTVKSVRYLRIQRLRAELRRTYEMLCKRQTTVQPQLQQQTALVHHLTAAARQNPDLAAQILLDREESRSHRSLKQSSIDKRKCCYQQEDEVCSRPALPYTRHCTKHIMYNVDQLLFEHCTAKFADNTQCCIPVFDMCHELPLCLEHAKKRDNYNKMASEPKPKKPRKKSKPPALTRPPKRGKKKKPRSGSLRPSPTPLFHSSAASLDQGIPAATSVGSQRLPTLPPVASLRSLPSPSSSSSSLSSSSSSASSPPFEPVQVPPVMEVGLSQASVPLAPNSVIKAERESLIPSHHQLPTSIPSSPDVENFGYVAASVSATSVGNSNSTGGIMNGPHKELVERMEPDLAADLENQFSPDTIDKSLELPLDAAELASQATKLLEEHDFTEVLNKISDDAFSDFFAESKNGEYVPSKEETEELERALAAVSKDVHLARESLAKLSGGTGATTADVADLPELDAFPDLPLSSSDLNSLTQALMGSNNPEVLRTVAMLTSDLGATADITYVPHSVSMVDMTSTNSVTGSFVPIQPVTSAETWMLPDQTVYAPVAQGAQAPHQGALSKQSVLAQESVS